jgi:hypothetical protein
MRSPRFLLACALAIPAVGCESTSDAPGTPVSQSPSDSGLDSAAAQTTVDATVLDSGVSSDATADAALPTGDASPPPTVTIASNAADAGIVGIQVAPLTLVPSFSPTVTDYYVRCAASSNAITVTVTDSSGTQTTSLDVVPDQEISVWGQYWIRCLPPDFPPITVTLPTPDSGPTPGYYLVNNGTYAIVLDTNGTPVWYARGSSVENVDSLVPDTISYVPNNAGAFGIDASEHYEMHDLDTVTTTDLYAVGSPTDGHELRLLPNGDHLIFTYPVVNGVDLSSFGNFATGLSAIVDCEVQEIDPSGNLVWSWFASQHIAFSESIEATKATVNGTNLIDVYHCNSIDVDGAGNLLVSSRYANAVFYIDKATGTVLWKMGGTPSNKDGAQIILVSGDPESTFDMQHDARFQPDGGVSVFDDHGRVPDSGLARGVQYAVDLDAGLASVVFQFYGTATSNREGSFRRYPDGHSVIGWGYIATDPRVVTEVDSNGNDVLDIAFGGVESYRAVKVPLSELDAAVLRSTTAM